MSAQDSDGVEDAIQGVTQVAMTTAARLGEQLARAREKRAREAQASSEQTAREYTGRFNAEREVARAALAPVHRPQWWDDAQGEEISKAYQTATAWKDIDPEAARAEQRIVDEVHTRFGVDLTRENDPRGVTDALAREEQARANAQDERGAGRAEAAQAVGLMAGADAVDHQAEAAANQRPEAGSAYEAEAEAAFDSDNPFFTTSGPFSPEPPDWSNALLDGDGAERPTSPDDRDGSEMREDGHAAYDSAERREELATSLDHIGNRAAVDARVHADVSQGRPATDATASTPGRAPKARKTRGSGQPTRTAQRTGRSR